MWERIQIVLSRDDLLNLRETSQFHAVCEWFGLGWTGFVATGPRHPTTDLGSVMMSEHLGMAVTILMAVKSVSHPRRLFQRRP